MPGRPHGSLSISRFAWCVPGSTPISRLSPACWSPRNCRLCRTRSRSVSSLRSRARRWRVPPRSRLRRSRRLPSVRRHWMPSGSLMPGCGVQRVPRAPVPRVRVAGRMSRDDAGGPAHTPGRPDLPERGRGGRGRRGTSRRFRMPNWSSPLLLRGLAAAGAVVIIAGAGLLFTQGHNNSGSNAGSAGSGSARREARGSLAAEARRRIWRQCRLFQRWSGKPGLSA